MFYFLVCLLFLSLMKVMTVANVINVSIRCGKVCTQHQVWCANVCIVLLCIYLVNSILKVIFIKISIHLLKIYYFSEHTIEQYGSKHFK